MRDRHACRQRLGGLVAYIPLPVVAGYLGYLGYFCVAAAFAQVTALPISAPPSFYLLFLPKNAATIPNSLALIACCAVMMVGVRVWRSSAALPTILVAIPAFWYAVLAAVVLVAGIEWADLMVWLQDHHWVERPPDVERPQQFWEVRPPPLRPPHHLQEAIPTLRLGHCRCPSSAVPLS